MRYFESVLLVFLGYAISRAVVSVYRLIPLGPSRERQSGEVD
jgi:hypothetical protein